MHPVELDSFRIDATVVTAPTFVRFVEATGCQTEESGSSAVFHLLLKAPRAEILGVAPDAP